MHISDEVAYAGYRIVVLSGHKHDDSLSKMSNLGTTEFRYMEYLDQKEKADVRCMKVLECDVARPIPGLPLPLADKRYTHCNVGDDGWPNLNGLGIN